MTQSRHFDILSHVVEIANSSVDIGERLDSILGVINSHMGARLTALFMQEHRKSQLTRANLWPPRVGGEPATVQFGQGLVGEVAMRREPQTIEAYRLGQDEALDTLCRADERVDLFPVMDDNRLYAVLVMLYPKAGVLDSDDVRLLQMVSREMAGAIRNFRLYFEAKKRIAELNVLSDLGRAAISTIEVDQLLDTVAGICAKLLGARGGLIHIFSVNGEEFNYKAIYGMVPPSCLEKTGCAYSCLEEAAGVSRLRVQVCQPDPDSSEFEHGLCVPLAFKGRYRGRLCVFDKAIQAEGMGPGFTADDHDLLASMSSMVSAALENALTFQRIEDLAQRNEEMVGALATMFEISTVLMTTVDFDETVQIILHAVIHPTGLDHDRVVLFLLGEGAGGEEANLRAVADLVKPKEGVQLKELVQTLNQAKEEKPKAIAVEDDNLAKLVIPITPQDSVLARTVAEKKVIQVENPAEDRSVAKELVEALGPHPMVTVPMFAKGKVVGVILVNNARSRRGFSDRDIKLLAMLANLGGLAVENSRLYQHLENANHELAQMRNRLLEADKLAALGEVAAGVAHEIRNPLVSIGGFTRRIRKKVGDDSPITPYLDVIIEEVTRLERTLNEMLDFSTDARDHYEERNLNLIMDQSLELLRRELDESKVEVVRDYNQDLPQIYCDERQIKHIFLNLFLNAIQAMGKEGGKLILRTYGVTREGKQFVAGEVSDSGGGISMEVIHKIFNPFFTTKDTGSGLGLSIVHKIITRHFGQVEVHNREGEGASFLVTLPAAEEGRAYLK
jgi:two-component system sensor histidine kinase HydH